MKRFLLFGILLFAVSIRESMAIDFSDKEKAVIYTNAVKVLEDYNTIVNRIGESVVNDIEKAKSDAESFLELFVNRQVLIFNDLDPSHEQHKTSEFYEAETYTNSLILWYPDGITVNLDLANARVSDIMSHEENVYTLDILAKKAINGNYLNEAMNKNVEELTFRIAFSMENKTPSKFRIVGIRNAASNIAIDYSQALKDVNAENFAPDDLLKVQGEVKAKLQDYTQMLGLIGDPQELQEDKVHYKETFLALFKAPDIKVYNDITPSPETNLISASDYLNSYITDYPEGIKNLSINPDSAKFGQVSKATDGSYYTYATVTKFFSGSYKGKQAFRQAFPLNFKVSFNASGNTFTDFRITGVDIASVNYYEASQDAAELKKPDIVIKPVTRKGFTVMLAGSFGQTSINDQDIKSLTTSQNAHSWDVKPLSGFITAVGISYYLNDNIYARTGVEFNKYSSRFTLSGKFTNIESSTDINLVSYTKIVEANIDSLVTINYITMPFLAGYTSGKPGKIGFYGEGGLKISIPQKAEYHNTGSFQLYGYYPTAPAAMQYKYAPFSGFIDRQNIDKTSTLKIKGFNLAFYASAGVSIPLGYYSSVTAGPEIILGISDILSDKDVYRDIFGKTYTHKPTQIRNIGFRVCLNYKL